MKNKLLTILVFGMIFISMAFISANEVSLDSLGTGKQNTNFTINQPCASATYMTLSTILYPDKTSSFINSNMTYVGSGMFQYNFTDTLQLGRYDVCFVTDGCEIDACLYFEITPSGISQTVSQGLGSTVFLILMIVLMFTFAFVGYKLTQSDNLWILGIFLLFLSVLLLIYNTWLGYEYHSTLTGLSGSSVPETIFYIFLLLLVVGLLSGLALLFLHWRKVFKYIKREIKSKPKDDRDIEDWDFDEWGGKGPYGR